MRATSITFASVFLSLAVSGTAGADGFDEAAKKASPIHDAKGMSALLWSQQASCGKMTSDLLRRQCRGVREARQARVTEQTYLVDVAGPAIDIKPGPKNKSVEVILRSCIACADEGPIIMGKGAHTVNAQSVQAASLNSAWKTFKDTANAEHYSKYVATRLRAQFLVKVPASVERFKAAGREGFKVDVIGYRIYDPCQGTVLGAKPESKRGPVRAASCKDEPAMEQVTAKDPTPVASGRPDRLNTSQIKDAMKKVSPLTDKCFKAYGIEGTASFKMLIGGDGSLKKVEQSGDFDGTPTGICLDKAMKSAAFPKSKKKETPITYPIVLQ